MPYREWTPLWKALGRLASELRISRTIAEEIVRLVLVDGEVSTRGCYRYDRLPRLIPKDCWVQSPVQHNFMLPDWLDIEIDWAGLLACAPNHLPRGLLDLHVGTGTTAGPGPRVAVEKVWRGCPEPVRRVE